MYNVNFQLFIQLNQFFRVSSRSNTFLRINLVTVDIVFSQSIIQRTVD